MQELKQEFEVYDHQYIITDRDGNITNVTEGLNHDLGLNSKFFKYSDSMFQVYFNIQLLCPDILTLDIEEILEDEGTHLVLDTRNILNHIDLENLTSEELLDIRSKLGRYQIYA